MSSPSFQYDDARAAALAGALLEELFPICRSITGDGLRESLQIIGRHVPLEVTEVPSGTEVFDWTVPNEWNIRDAFIKNSSGERVVDFQVSNLHVVSYSEPINEKMTLKQLRPHLHALPSQPNAIPYLTTYFERNWGFCLSQRQLDALKDETYEVVIDSSLEPGSMTMAEAVLAGERTEEVLISTYCCHPSMANNELSGPILAVLLYHYLAALPRRRYTYRFHWGSETIGALAYLAQRGDHLTKHVIAGFILTCCGDAGKFTYKKVRSAGNPLDDCVLHALKHSGVQYEVRDFFPTGSDDRQYSSPGFNLPMGTLMRSVYGEYPEYHTSLDDLQFVTPAQLVETLEVYIRVLTVLESRAAYRNLKPYGEPQLGKYGLYNTLGGLKTPRTRGRHMRYILNYSDGQHDLLDIAEKLDTPIWELTSCTEDLIAAGLLELKE